MTTPHDRIAESIRSAVVLSDVALVDAANKVNILGANWGITGQGPNGVTPQQAVVVLMEVPARHAGEQFALSLALLNEAGLPVEVAGPTGTPQPLRLQQLVQADRPSLPGVHLPAAIPAKANMVLGIGGGIPLAPGIYTWQVEVDGNSNPQWQASFCVVGPPPPPVFGGPSGPADIPELPQT